jgi:hypothetical protein
MVALGDALAVCSVVLTLEMALGGAGSEVVVGERCGSGEVEIFERWALGLSVSMIVGMRTRR